MPTIPPRTAEARLQRVRRGLLLAGAGALLSACVPVLYGSYYRPSAAGAPYRLRGSMCYGATGPETGLEIDAPLKLSASAQRGYTDDRDRPNLLPLRLSIALPSGRSLQFAADRPDIVEIGSGRALAGPLSVVARRTVSLPADAEVDLARLQPAATERAGPVQVDWGMAGPDQFAPSELLLRGPDLRSGGTDHRFQPVRLALPPVPATQAIARYRSAAQQQRLRQRTEDCRRDTPQRACDNILAFDDTSFEQVVGPATWRGGFLRYVDHRQQVAALRGSLSLVLRDTRHWRLIEPAVELRDATGPRSERLPLKPMRISFDDRIALSTPLRPSAEGAGDTTLAIEVLLPDAVPDFEVRLPPATLDGQRVDFPALRFEIRRFDGGVLPFNC